MKKIIVFLFVIIGSMIMNSCKKSETVNSTYPYNIKMTDAPGPYSAVFVDVQGVEITGSGGQTVLLSVHPGIYNLLNFSNGIDTMIASGSLGTASVQQIRLILGTNNSVVVNSVSYPLSTPSADQSGLKLQVHQTLQAGVLYSVLLDFDANSSIIQTGSGTYKLKPVIRTIETPISGAIKGNVSPVGTLAFVMASTNVSYSTNVTSTGDFLLMGLPAGVYSVTVTPALPYNPVTLNNIIVTTGVTTNVGTVTF
jgi:hypothetical protein